MHIKFLNHGKGSAAHASAYVLDELDHLGNVRAGVEVLRGDAITFNAVCDASPHLWKYTSGVIAWSKEDDPTQKQIQEVLNDFEKHSFSGLDPSQYHLFAVLHTDDDGSKHIHILTPRFDIQSGKSLNIAPPGHEKHFDSLRDYFNTKYDWSRPDDLLLMQTTQEPNYIAKLNAQAKNILTQKDIETLTKKQFCKTVDNYVKTLLKTQTVENRADIIDCIEQVKGVEEVKQSKDFLTVTLTKGKKHRLKGDFYNEQFEIGLYSERLRAEAESRPTANEFVQAIRNAQSIRDDYQAKRRAYHSKQHAFTASTANNNTPQSESKLDIDRNRQSITTSHKKYDCELQNTNRCTIDSVSEYKYYGNIKSEIEHRFVFSFTSRSPSDYKSPITGHQDRPNKSREIYSKPSTASDIKPKRTNQQSVSEPFDQRIEQSESISRTSWDSDICNIDVFNQFLFRLSNQKQPENNRSTKANNPREIRSNYLSNQLFEQPKEIGYADRNRPFSDRTKQLVSEAERRLARTEQLVSKTNLFIRDYCYQIYGSRVGIKGKNQTFASREKGSTSPEFITQKRNIENRTKQFFTGFTEKFSNQFNESLKNTINRSIEQSEFRQYYKQCSESRTNTYFSEDYSSTNRFRAGSIKTITTESINQYRRRLEDSRQATTNVRNNIKQLDRIDQQFEQLTGLVKNIRLKPKCASSLELRSDNYYQSHLMFYNISCATQDDSFENKDELGLIKSIANKWNHLSDYMESARAGLGIQDNDKLKQIIKNDERMLKYLQCEIILDPQNEHLVSERKLYQKCLDTFADLKDIFAEKELALKEYYNKKVTSVEPENIPKPKPKPSNDFTLGF